MKNKIRILITLAFATVALSGCIGGKTPGLDGDEGAGLVQAPAASATDSLGSLTGQIVSLALDPLAGALILLHVDTDLRSAESDAEGRYTFNDVAPGSYVMDVTMLGYQNQRRQVDVAAASITEESFRLEMIEVKNPYYETIPFTGFYDCAFGAPFITDTCTFGVRTAYDLVVEETGDEPPFPRDAQHNINTFYWSVGPGVSAVMSELVWTDVAEATDEMMMLLSSTPIDNACDCSEVDYIEYTGPSPARAIVGKDLDADAFASDLHVMPGEAWVSLEERLASAPNGTVEVASRAFLPFSASFAYGQKFELYVTVFYHMVPDPGFTGIPDQ